jgi:hypothetical protein
MSQCSTQHEGWSARPVDWAGGGSMCTLFSTPLVFDA